MMCAHNLKIIKNSQIKEAMELRTMNCYDCIMLRADCDVNGYNYCFGHKNCQTSHGRQEFPTNHIDLQE